MAIFNGDDCTEVSNIALASHTPSGPNAHGSAAWSSLLNQFTTGPEVFPAIQANSDQIRSLTATFTIDDSGTETGWMQRLAPIAPDPDCSLQITIDERDTTSTITPIYLMVRVADVDNWYGVARYRSGATPTNNCVLYKMVAGTPTSLATDNFAISNGDTLKLEAIGTALKVYHNGSEVTNLSTTDSSITAAGYFGIGMGSVAVSSDKCIANWRLDDLIAEDLGSGSPTYSPALFARNRRRL